VLQLERERPTGAEVARRHLDHGRPANTAAQAPLGGGQLGRLGHGNVHAPE
jgi:hypothetical protein